MVSLVVVCFSFRFSVLSWRLDWGWLLDATLKGVWEQMCRGARYAVWSLECPALIMGTSRSQRSQT